MVTHIVHFLTLISVADTRHVPTPPATDSERLVPPRGSPRLFGPRSPRDSLHIYHPNNTTSNDDLAGEEIEIKTDEEAERALEEVVRPINQSRAVDEQALVAEDISDTLDQILKSYTAGGDLPSVGDMSDTSHMTIAPTTPLNVLAISDEFGNSSIFRMSRFQRRRLRT